MQDIPQLFGQGHKQTVQTQGLVRVCTVCHSIITFRYIVSYIKGLVQILGYINGEQSEYSRL